MKLGKDQFEIIPLKDKIVLPENPTESFASMYGGWKAESDALSMGKMRFESDNERILIGDATEPLTGTGIFQGLDTDRAYYDWRVGNPAGQYIHWDGSTSLLTIVGTINASAINIPDTTTANSFHVDTSGNAWWGAVLIGDATAKILNTGVATFSNANITGGTIGGQSVANVGYVATTTADSVPTGLTCSSTTANVASDGSVSSSVVLTWTAISSNTFDHYLIRYKKASYTYYTYIPSNVNTITIEGLTPNVSYNFGICSVNKYGTVSAYSADISQTTATSTTPPATTTSLSATAGIQYVIFEWTHNTESDLASYNIYRNTSDDSATATLIGNCRTNYFIDGGRTGGQIYYYWVKAVNTSGLISASFSTVRSATPRNVNSADTNVSNQGWTQTCVFTVTDTDTVAWAAGVFTTASGTSYNIDAGNTGNMSARTFIYLDIAVSTTAYQITTTATTAVGDGKVLVAVAQNNTTEAIFQVFGGVGGANWKGTDIVAGSITTSEIAANTIVAGNIASGTITATQIDTTSITSLSNLALTASQILIDGTVYLTNWRHASDLTKIDGGDIYANSVTTSQLNFTPVQSTDVIAKINASAEGITIDADNLTISGSTTFASGYNPTDKVDELAGSYASAASGARVLIFPDANTGIQVIDDATNNVFKVEVGGTNVGDVTIGNWGAGQGFKYDKDDGVAGTSTFAGALSAATGTLGVITTGQITLDTTGYIRTYGKDNYADTTAGLFMGYDTDAYKLNVGSSTKYLKFDGTDISYTGNIKHPYTAGENITAGQIVCIKNTVKDVISATGDAEDVYIQCAHTVKNDPDTNYHTGQIYIGSTVGGDQYYAYIKFDVAHIATDIQSAKLRLALTVNPASSSIAVIKRVTSDWAYDTITYNTRPTVYTEYDYDYQTIPDVGGTWFEWDITALVRAWKEGTYSNYGIRLELSDVNVARFTGQDGTEYAPIYRRVNNSITDAKVYLTDDDDYNLSRNVVGIAAETKNANETALVYDGVGNLLSGNIVSGANAGSLLYLDSVPGAITTSASDTVRGTEIGFSRTDGDLFLMPQKPYLIEWFPRYATQTWSVSGVSYFNIDVKNAETTAYLFPPQEAMKCVINWYAYDNDTTFQKGNLVVYRLGSTFDGCPSTTASSNGDWITASWNGNVITISALAGVPGGLTLNDNYPRIHAYFYSR